MKCSLKAISGLGLVIILLGLLFPAPASAATAAWSAEAIPSTTYSTLGPTGMDVRDIAVAGNGNIIYAAAGDSIAGNVIYRSADTGASWSTLSTGMAADLVAVAPERVLAARFAYFYQLSREAGETASDEPFRTKTV